jgi:hypothetical protein
MITSLSKVELRRGTLTVSVSSLGPFPKSLYTVCEGEFTNSKMEQLRKCQKPEKGTKQLWPVKQTAL